MKPLIEVIRPTTILKPEKLRSHLGIDLTIAAETFQHTGSFKFRAAYNVALNVPNDTLLTASSGNFGQALAYSSKLLGKRCSVVMPETSAKVKIDAVKNYGATADLIDVRRIGRAERVAELAEQMPEAYIASPYDDPLVIEGNSTLADEIAGEDFDVIIAPIGGGGLISGLSKGLCRNAAQSRLIGAEPLIGNDAARSLRSGKIEKNDEEPMTIADGARTVSLGKHNWEIIKDGVSEIVEVTEEKIKEALKLYYGFANLKTEPTGALSLGAVLENPKLFSDRKVCVVVSGGNVDAETYCRLLA